MTLILAEVCQNDGFFVADTLLNDVYVIDRPTLFNGAFHALKVHILCGKLCIGFAGNYDLGLTVINQVVNYLEENEKTIDDLILPVICSLYEKEYKSRDLKPDACEFLVMISAASGNVLAKITATQLVCEYKKIHRAYIGSNSAYCQLQSLRELSNVPDWQHVQHLDGTFKIIPFQLSDLEKNFNEISDAMIKIPTQIKKPSVAVLGDSVIRVRVARSGNFEYLPQVVRGSSEAESNIGISLLTSVGPKYGIGIFYEVGGIGDLFIAGDREHVRRIKAFTIAEFKKIAYQDYQLTLDGAGW